jgi:anti-sigma B factor antagonist
MCDTLGMSELPPVLEPPSELTEATVAIFDGMAKPFLAAGASVVVDLTGVTFISSAGLGRLVDLGRRLDELGARAVLAGGQRSVLRLLRTVGLDRMFPIFGSLHEAAAFLGEVAASGDEAAV